MTDAHTLLAKAKAKATALALSLAAGAAAAHDTWFVALPTPATAAAPAGATLLALGTGNQYPLQESGIDAPFLARRGCATAGAPATDGAALTLKALRNTPTSLLLEAPRGAATCWVQLTAFDLEMAPAKVPVYLKEIQATPDVLASWAAMQARGLPWRERYTKHARIELGTPNPQPAPVGLDLYIENAGPAVRLGTNISVQALRDGQPLPGLALELRSESSPLGIWRRTDAQGRIEVRPPLAGRWLLRGVDLRVSASDPDRWDSRFVTLAFDVAPAAAAPAAAANASALASASQPD